MKHINGIRLIGIDHGYGNIKTANCCFPTGVVASDTEPTFKQDLLIYEGRYYQIGIGHKEYLAEKSMDEDYYVLTLAAIARELAREKITEEAVHLAVGLPLSWLSKQKAEFHNYLLKKEAVAFSFRGTEYRIRIVLCDLCPQLFPEVFVCEFECLLFVRIGNRKQISGRTGTLRFKFRYLNSHLFPPYV